jgi:hypothetical protein
MPNRDAFAGSKIEAAFLVDLIRRDQAEFGDKFHGVAFDTPDVGGHVCSPSIDQASKVTVRSAGQGNQRDALAERWACP